MCEHQWTVTRRTQNTGVLGSIDDCHTRQIVEDFLRKGEARALQHLTGDQSLIIEITCTHCGDVRVRSSGSLTR